MRGVWDSGKRATVLGASSRSLDEISLTEPFGADQAIGERLSENMR